MNTFLPPEMFLLTPQALAAAYTDPHNKQRGAHEPYGLTLFYHVAHRDDWAAESWEHLVQHFDRIVGGWVARIIHGLTIDEIRGLSHDALTRFWVYFGPPQFAKA